MKKEIKLNPGCFDELGCVFIVIAVIILFNAGRILDMLDRLIDKI